MISISDKISFYTYGSERLRGRLRCSRMLIVVSASLAASIIQGCSMNEKMIAEHERICRQNMKVIVHDDDLWREYRAQSEAAHRREVKENPPIRGRTLYDPVGNFTISYGDEKSYFRPNVNDKILRNDIFVMKGDKVVVQIVDFIAQYRSIDGATSFNCLHFYENLIVGSADQ